MTERGLIAGKYEIIRQLGEGTYGSVYLVRHILLGVQYALKLLNATLARDKSILDRFRTEGAILEHFSHPGSIKLRDFGITEDGLYYMTMDYCEGQVLSDHVEQVGALPVLDALDIIEQVLSVLAAAHQVGIIHRDIKPENIMLSTSADGAQQVRVLDFGVAQLQSGLIVDLTSTLEGVSVGTPYYMSPEQAAGGNDLDQRSDLYSVGVVLYQLLSGHVPFQGEGLIQTLIMHLTKPVQPFAHSLGLPEFVDTIMLKALAKERNDRYASAEEFLNDLAELRVLLATGESAPSTPSTGSVEPIPAEPQRPTRILCLDDDELILHMMSYILQSKGFEVYTAKTFAVIHSYLFAKEVDLMLCDVQMPGLPGTKICQMLKQTKKNLKIVLFSNVPERELEILSADCKADGWISKNDKPDEWLRCINQTLLQAPAK